MRALYASALRHAIMMLMRAMLPARLSSAMLTLPAYTPHHGAAVAARRHDMLMPPRVTSARYTCVRQRVRYYAAHAPVYAYTRHARSPCCCRDALPFEAFAAATKARRRLRAMPAALRCLAPAMPMAGAERACCCDARCRLSAATHAAAA